MRNSLYLSIFAIFFLSNICSGQATANFTASVTIIEPIGISTTSHLNFAQVDAQTGGEVILTPDGTRWAAGGVILEDGGQVSAASFEVTGQAGAAFSISIPDAEYTLSNGSENIIIRDFKSSLGGQGTIGENSKIFSLGATLDIKDRQTPGIYTNSMPLAVTVNYN